MKKTVMTLILLSVFFELRAQEKIQTEVGLKNDFVYLNGKVGIGLTNPSVALEVNGSIKGTGSLSAGSGYFQTTGDYQLRLYGLDSWAGIEFKDVNGFEKIWFNGIHETFAIGGGGSNVANKKLHINGGTSIGTSFGSSNVPVNGLAIEGNLGVGYSNPETRLQVNGDITVGASNYAAQPKIFFRQNDHSSSGWTVGSTSTDSKDLMVYGYETDGNFKVYTNNTQRLVVKHDGNLGIGVSNPTEKLQVAGNFRLSGNLKAYAKAYIGSSEDVQLRLTSPDTWTGIDFEDANGREYIWFNGEHETFSIGGGGSNVANKKLHVNGGTSIGTAFRLNGSPVNGLAVEGKVGIGTNVPTKELDVNGEIISRGLLTVDGAQGISSDGYINLHRYATNSNVSIGNNGTNVGLLINNGDLTVGGKIGIGTSTVPSDYKIAVAGKMITEEVKVQLQTAWPDYVFSKEYNLPSLTSVEKHIKEKGHLKDIPNAREVEKNGIELGKMNAKLLQKIEELTLYTIQQEKKITELEKYKKMSSMQAQKLKELEQKINTILSQLKK